MSNHDSKNMEIVGIVNDEYTRLCKELYRIPRSGDKFILSYGTKEIKTIRSIHRERVMYDENGKIINTPIEFIEVNDFSHKVYSGEEKRIIIDENNIPDSIDIVLGNGDRENIYTRAQ